MCEYDERGKKDGGDHFQKSVRCVCCCCCCCFNLQEMSFSTITVLFPYFCYISDVLKYHHFDTEILFGMERW